MTRKQLNKESVIDPASSNAGRSQRYQQAVEALRSLIEHEGAQIANYAYAESVSEIRKREFGEIHVATLSEDSHVCIHRLMGKPCARQDKPHTVACNARNNIPASDHLSEWQKDGKTLFIVSQPYGMSFDSLKKTVLFCESNGLAVNISAESSWHFPGRTIAVEYTSIENKTEKSS